MTGHAPRSLGHLNPGGGDVSLERFSLGPMFAEVVRHVWVARWRLAAGEGRVQRVLTYPGCNAVFLREGDELFVRLHGPAPRASERRLEGSGWVVGVLLEPGATALMTARAPKELVGGSEPLLGAPLAEVSALMADAEQASLARRLEEWLAPQVALMDDEGRLVNRICAHAEASGHSLSVAELARANGLSERALHRLLMRRVGRSGKWLLERSRLQHAAFRLRQDGVQLAEIAAELGYADQAHFTRAFKAVMGMTPARAREEFKPGASSR